jgi:ComF family protein
LARAIHRFKYEDHPELAPALAELIAPQALALLKRRGSKLLAIPLHRRRFRQRKFDQAQLLTGALGFILGCQPILNGLARVRETSRQVGLSEAGREQNVKDAFVAEGSLAGRRVTLVDDVLTTGATARAAAQALLRAGAQEVSVLTLARAVSEATP